MSASACSTVTPAAAPAPVRRAATPTTRVLLRPLPGPPPAVGPARPGCRYRSVRARRKSCGRSRLFSSRRRSSTWAWTSRTSAAATAWSRRRVGRVPERALSVRSGLGARNHEPAAQGPRRRQVGAACLRRRGGRTGAVGARRWDPSLALRAGSVDLDVAAAQPTQHGHAARQRQTPRVEHGPSPTESGTASGTGDGP
jgi:hypothetical protein